MLCSLKSGEYGISEKALKHLLTVEMMFSYRYSNVFLPFFNEDVAEFAVLVQGISCTADSIFIQFLQILISRYTQAKLPL